LAEVKYPNPSGPIRFGKLKSNKSLEKTNDRNRIRTIANTIKRLNPSNRLYFRILDKLNNV
jgi:hypothetical protein